MPKIIHERSNCIGCGACAAVCPDFWEMDNDGKSILKGANHTKKGEEIVKSELEIDDVACNKQASESCPVNIIKIE